jgi:adenylate cyclase
MPWRHPVAGGLAVTLVLAGAVALHRRDVVPLQFLERLERAGLDRLFQLRGPIAPGPETVVVAYDDATLARDATLFEHRAGWARVIRAAKAAGAKVIGVDAFFATPERMLPVELEEAVRQYFAAAPAAASEPAGLLLERIRDAMQGDAALAAALGEAGNVVLSLHLDATAPDEEPAQSLSRGKYGQSVVGGAPLRRSGVISASLAVLNDQARALGSVTVDEDDTSTTRRVELGRGGVGGVYAPLAVQVLAQYLDVPRGKVVFEGPTHQVRIGALKVETDDNGVWLNFRGPTGTFKTYPAVDLVEGRLPAGALEGKIVLIGMTHLFGDRVLTPFGQRFPGVEVHATLVDNLLRNDPLRRAPWWVDVLACLAVGFAISALYWPHWLGSPGLQVAGSVALLAGWLAVVWAAFATRGLWLFWTGPVVVLLLAGSTCLALSYLGEGLQRLRLRKAFAHYLGEDVIREMLENPGMLRLGGERRNLTVLFSDIRGFTTLSEKLSPEQLVSLLNTYLTPMTQTVLSRGGLLDKYIGDAIMAVFGAPVPSAEHPAKALSCALQMHRELQVLKTLPAMLGLDLAIGVGVNTGDMVVGNMGSAERFDYTVAGDAVNLASRLEGLTKLYGVFCLVGDSTRKAAGPGFTFREVELVQVKGRHEAVALHELLGGEGQAVARYQSLPVFEQAVAAFRKGRLAEAREGFRAFLVQNEGDRVSELYLERLAALGNAAPEGWSPVFAPLTK